MVGLDPAISCTVWRGPISKRMPQPTSASEPALRGRCPICGKAAAAPIRPFCSQRCKDVDLNRWLSGVYSVPAVEVEEEPDTEAPAPS